MTTLRMEEDRGHMTERMLDLTLEIIYLLTGEDYEVVRKTSGEILEPNTRLHGPPHSMTPKRHNQGTILDVIQKMIELLTGEVPIRCQDVSGELKYGGGHKDAMMGQCPYVEGQKELYKDAMMEERLSPPSLGTTQGPYKDAMMEDQPLDGAGNSNPPEGWKGPLYSRYYSQEDHNYAQRYQREQYTDVKVEVKVEEEEIHMGAQATEEGEIMVTMKKEEEEMGDQQPTEEEGDMVGTKKEEDSALAIDTDGADNSNPPEGWTTPLYSQHGARILHHYQDEEQIVIKVEVKEEEEETGVGSDQQPTEEEEREEDMMGTIKEEDWSPDISPGGRGIGNSSGACFISPADGATEEDDFSHYPPGRLPFTGNAHLYLDGSLPNTSNPEGYRDGSHPVTLLLRLGSGSAGTRNVQSDPGRSSNVLTVRHGGGEKRFPCPECWKCFARNSLLLQHQRRHTAERRYPCYECGKCFMDRGSLRIHQRSHTGERPFSCSGCGKYFSVKANLVRHQKTLTCARCGKCFIQKGYLIKHQRLHNH